MRASWLRPLACIALTAAAATAQDAVRERLARLEQRLVEVAANERELREIRDRHAAGDPVDAARWLTVTDVDRARATDAAATDPLERMRARTEVLRGELTALRAQVDDARARERVRREGDSLPRPEELARLAARARGDDTAVATAPPVPAADVAAGAPAVTEPLAAATAPAASPGAAPNASTRPPAAPAPDDGTVRVRGSEDRLRAGNASLEAGIAMLREALALERAGRTAVAEARRAEARARLEAAHAELEPLARGAAATPAALFALARCEEKLGRVAVADLLYAAVMERDRSPGASGRTDYGPFGRAARTARAVMHWIDDTADWRPRRDVDQIRWDDR